MPPFLTKLIPYVFSYDYNKINHIDKWYMPSVLGWPSHCDAKVRNSYEYIDRSDYVINPSTKLVIKSIDYKIGNYS